MRTRLKQPTEAESQERKRMRMLCAHLHNSAKAKLSEAQAADSLKEYMRLMGYEYSDLVALRQRPYEWDMHHAGEWTWLLHRIMNAGLV